MRYYFAPMEGVTGWLFRQAHRHWFSGVDRYFMPFLSPRQEHAFTRREAAIKRLTRSEKLALCR